MTSITNPTINVCYDITANFDIIIVDPNATIHLNANLISISGKITIIGREVIVNCSKISSDRGLQIIGIQSFKALKNCLIEGSKKYPLMYGYIEELMQKQTLSNDFYINHHISKNINRLIKYV